MCVNGSGTIGVLWAALVVADHKSERNWELPLEVREVSIAFLPHYFSPTLQGGNI